MNYEIQDIYIIFRKEQSLFFNRPYKLPKNWDKFYEKLNINTKEILNKITNYFNTKWDSIDPNKYFSAGFELYNKSFTYQKFFDNRILKLYIQRDKIKKYETEASKKLLIENLNFILSYMKERSYRKDLSILSQYAKLREGFERICISHYRQNKISKFCLVYLLSRKYCILDVDEYTLIPEIKNKYRELIYELNNYKEFLIKLEEKIG